MVWVIEPKDPCDKSELGFAKCGVLLRLKASMRN